MHKTFAELKAQRAATGCLLSIISVGKDPYTNEWCVWERDEDGRMLYRAVFLTEAEAMAHGNARLTGVPSHA